MKLTKQMIALALGVALTPAPTHFVSTIIGQAFAGSTSTTMTVSASVPENCNFSNGSITLAFGVYDPIGANATTPLDSTTTFGIRCTKGTSAQLAMNDGVNANGSQRRLENAGALMNYQLYTSSDYSTIWNESNTVTYLATNSSPTKISVYGRIPAGQLDLPSGTYTDTVTITATY